MNATVTSVGAAGQNQHSVTLNWTELSAGATFEIYRATTSGGQDYNSLLATTAVATYTDTANLVEGETYYYTTVAVVGGLKSDPSNEASALIPTKPAPPSGLVAKAT